MTKHLLKCCLSICVLLCGLSLTGKAQRTLPSVEVKNMNGKTVNLATLKNDGKPMVVFAWEITCQPCISEFNAIAKVYDEWKKETGVKIIAVSIDDSRSSARVNPLVKSKGWDFEVYLDPNQAFKRAMNITYCPYVFVLDGKGEVVWQKGGYTPGDDLVIYDIVQKTAKGEKIN